MFGFYPRPQPTYYQSPYARAVAQQRAYELEQQRQLERKRELEYQRALQAQELERRRAAARSRYFPDGYDEYDDEEQYLSPQQRALLEARRRQQALEQRRFEAARQARENAQQHAARDPSPPSPRRSTSPSQPAPSSEQLHSAATKIQTTYRVHRALRAISVISTEFARLKSSFATPTTIDYQSDGQTSSVPVPTTLPEVADDTRAKLAYTPTNVPLHTYAEMLSRLLVSLDGIESHGDARVRDARRKAVRAVESEAARVESFWRRVWAAHQQEEEEHSDEEEVNAMVLDAPTPGPEASDSESEDEDDVDSEFATPYGTPVLPPAILQLSGSDSDAFLEDAVLVDREEEGSEKEFVIVP
ncbi:hypothetical protein C8F01DRAFT_302711 [Mycena amicta]|nr:hypothetical protein C8F01DRAFT_302711 [Mycena amicta]